jgi:hypothetical protein
MSSLSPSATISMGWACVGTLPLTLFPNHITVRAKVRNRIRLVRMEETGQFQRCEWIELL